MTGQAQDDGYAQDDGKWTIRKMSIQNLTSFFFSAKEKLTQGLDEK